MTRISRRLTLGAMIAALCSFAIPTASAQQRPAAPGVQSYGIWSALWWQWAFNKTAEESPLFGSSAQNPTVQYCQFSGLDSVWFAGGSFGGDPLLRECSVPAGTRLFLPVANAFSVQDPIEGRRPLKESKRQAAAYMDGLKNLVATVDGVSVLQPTLVKSPAFVITLPPGNIFGEEYTGRLHPATSIGVWLMTAPLSPGRHIIHIHAEFADGTIIDITYAVYVN